MPVTDEIGGECHVEHSKNIKSNGLSNIARLIQDNDILQK